MRATSITWKEFYFVENDSACTKIRTGIRLRITTNANGKRQFVPRDRVFTYRIVASCSSNTYLFMHVIHNSFAQFMTAHFLT